MIRFTTCVAVLAALGTSTVSAYKYDNTDEAASIASAASTLSGEGDYVFTNVATGQTLSFVRDDVTNVYPNDNGDALSVQFDGSQARLSGGNNKCISAQWQAIIGRGFDNAAVSYACKVGTGLLTGTDTLEPTKQWWYLVPAGSASSKTTTADSTSTSSESDSASFNGGVVLAAVQNKKKESSTSSSTKESSSSSNSKKAESTKTSSSSDSSYSARLAAVIPGDRSTWICKHSGQWVYERPGYEKLHPECEDDLAAYKASLKESRSSKRQVGSVKRRHGDLVPRRHASTKRASSQAYYIIAVDHILDQETRAIGSDSISTPGGYLSTVLNPWDKSDDSQQWIISSA